MTSMPGSSAPSNASAPSNGGGAPSNGGGAPSNGGGAPSSGNGAVTDTSHWWDPVHLLILYGRNTGDRTSETPDNETLVGREGQRVFVKNHLQNRSGPGAFLVTGHRGAGKTSFIRGCLDDYDKDVYTRYLNGDIGRSAIWDRVILLVFAGLAALGCVLLQEVIVRVVGFAYQRSAGSGALLLVSPLIVIGATPLVYAWAAVEAALQTLWHTEDSYERPPPWRALVSFALWFALIAVVGALIPLSSHAHAIALLLLGGAAAFFVTNFFPPFQSSENPRPTRAYFFFRVAFFFAVAAGAIWLVEHFAGSDSARGVYPSLPLASVLLGCGVLVRACHDGRQETARARSLVGTSITAFGAFWLWFKMPELAVRFGGVALGCCLFAWWKASSRKRDRSAKWVPDWYRPPCVLILKAAVAAALGIQLLLPVLAKVVPADVALWPASLRDNLDWELASNSAWGDSAWVITLVSTVLVLYWIEYEWVIAPFNALREDPAKRPDRVPSEGKGRKFLLSCARRLAIRQSVQTLPWRVMRSWLPVIVVSVNLGSDRLPYAEVVRSMLTSLRDKYAARFVALRSNLAATFWFFTVGVLLLFTRVSSDFLFATADERLLGGIQAANICGAAGHEAPPGVRMICGGATLGTGEATSRSELLQLLYFDLLGAPSSRDDDSAGTGELLCQVFSCSRPSSATPYAYLPALGTMIGLAAEGVVPSANVAVLLLREAPLPHFARRALDTTVTSARGLFASAEGVLGGAISSRRDAVTKPAVERPAGVGPEIQSSVELRLYYVLIFLGLVVATRILAWVFPILPYRRNVAALDAALDRLTTKRTLIPPSGFKRVSEFFNTLAGRTSVLTKEIDPEDARTVEASFVELVEALQRSTIMLPWRLFRGLSLPAPEIIFVFDELDKIGVRFEPLAGRKPTDEESETETDAERIRTRALTRLLSDMKSLLSSTPARFLFVGGRNLHDEWLADKTARLPLLTSIFREEIYLPSLLADLPPRKRNANWLMRIRQYVHVQFRRAKSEQDNFVSDLERPGILLGRRKAYATAFAPPEEIETVELEIYEDRGGRRLEGSYVLDLQREANQQSPFSKDVQKAVERELIHFLAYRSIGNPKRLREVLQSLLRPTARLVSSHRVKGGMTREKLIAENEQSVGLSELLRYRLQMLSETYRLLSSSFGSRYGMRDDKLAVSLFNLADFLFRFHGRGFSWSNLERVDELVHVHRAHDHRQILEELVYRWSAPYLHTILNGTYDFRFRSDFAHEIAFLSRQSEDEMAALNFTLDESEPLKALYSANLVRMKQEETPDALAALGELHEFDQEYELARFQFEKAIRRLDELHARIVGRGEHPSPVWDGLASTNRGMLDIRKHVTWGAIRVRLILQIGMTFEVSQHFERATLEYRNARTVARALIRAMIDQQGRDADLPLFSTEGSRRHVLKQLNIVFQPLFAEAWLAEKLPGGVDISVSLVESALNDLRRMLPFVREARLPETKNAATVWQSNFALIMSELHNKAGDLYFFKGTQIVESGVSSGGDAGNTAGKPSQYSICAWTEKASEECHGGEGYLLRAHEHYALALHEVRRFVKVRREGSEAKLGLSYGDTRSWQSIEPGGWPDYVFRLVGSNLCDLADAAFARVSFFRLVGRIKQGPASSASVGQTVAGTPASPPEKRAKEHVVDFDLAVRLWVDFGNARAKPPDLEAFKGIEKLKTASGDLEKHEKFGAVLPQPAGYDLGHVAGWLGVRIDEKGAGSDTHRRGRWGGARGDARPPTTLSYYEPHDDAQRLLFALYSNVVAADMLRRAGYIEDAARELMQVADAIAQYLWCAHAVMKIKSKVEEQKLPGWAQIVRMCPSKPGEVDHWDAFWDHLIDLAIDCLERAVQWFQRARGNERESTDTSPYRLGLDLPVKLGVIGCSIGLAGDRKRWEDANVPTKQKQRQKDLSALLTRMIGKDLWNCLCAGDSADEMHAAMRLLLKEIYLRHPFPMLSRLHALKVSLDEQVTRSGAESAESLRKGARHLATLAEQFDAPMHFTPFHLGFTLANTYLLHGDSLGDEEKRSLGELAMRYLNESENMVTMRLTYYRAAKRLYYLYDDFNDRQIHFNHALQMAVLEITSLLKAMVHATLINDATPSAAA